MAPAGGPTLLIPRMYNPFMHRRSFVTALAGGLAAASVAAIAQTAPRKGKFKQSVMAVNFPPNTPLDEMARAAARIGFTGMDLIEPKDWPTLKKYGLIPTLYHDSGNTFEDGIIHLEIHVAQEKLLHGDIDRAASAACPDVIVVGGQRRGMAPEEGIGHAVEFLNRVKAHAEEKGVNIVLEPVNLVDRPDQVLNRLGITAEICKRVNSPRVKILFDIYHAQKIDGDVASNLRLLYPWIAHVHTAGVPGRHEIDDTQELNYRFLALTLAELGFTGTVAHEYRPSAGRDPIKDLEQAFQIMNV
jgi:hydroxypyruvate isomerase